jgi:hypothetical protein
VDLLDLGLAGTHLQHSDRAADARSRAERHDRGTIVHTVIVGSTSMENVPPLRVLNVTFCKWAPTQLQVTRRGVVPINTDVHARAAMPRESQQYDIIRASATTRVRPCTVAAATATPWLRNLAKRARRHTVPTPNPATSGQRVRNTNSRNTTTDKRPLATTHQRSA